MMHHYGHFWGMGGSWFIGAVIIVAVVLLIAIGIRRRTGPERYAKDKALKVLRERYAKGEISKEEFEERQRTLS